MHTSMRHWSLPSLQKRPLQHPRRCHLQRQLPRLLRHHHSASTQSSQQHHSHVLDHSSDTGTIVGGVLGGIALVLISVIALCLRRKKRQNKINLSTDADPRPFDPHALYDPPYTGAQSAHSPDIGHNTTQNSTSPSSPPLVPNRRHPSVEQISGPNVISPFPSSQGSSSSGRDRKRLLEVSNDGSSLGQFSPDDGRPAPSSTSPRSDIPQSLTDEQADFITGLYNNDVPAAAVARVIERMLADRHAGVREWQRELGVARTASFATTAPPSYDLINQS